MTPTVVTYMMGMNLAASLALKITAVLIAERYIDFAYESTAFRDLALHRFNLSSNSASMHSHLSSLFCEGTWWLPG